MLKKNQILSALLCMFASMSPSLKAQSSDLIVGSNTSGNTTNFIAGSGTDNFYSNTYVGFNTNASSNRLGVFNAGTLLTNSENIYIGNNGSHNSLVISNGGTVASVVGYVGGQAVSSNNLVQVVDAHSSWNNSGDFYVGKSGWGNTMVISNGAVVNDGRAYIGGNASASNNLVQITGVGSRWSNNTFLNIGADGASNSMIISDGAVVYNNNNGVISGDVTSSNNVVQVTGIGSLWSNGGTLFMGSAGTGNTMVISNGGAVVNSTGSIGDSSSSSNNLVRVTGSGSSWHSSGDLYVGNSGSYNTMIVSDGAIVTNSANSYVGNDGGNNLALVTGSNTTWHGGDDFYIGYNASSNTMTISNGATVIADGGGYVAVNASSSNNLIQVTGSGSTWRMSNSLCLGFIGASNTMIISNGGAVISSSGLIGSQTSSTNNVVQVTGANSTWSNSGSVYIGYSGSGTLTVSDGGVVTATNLSIAHDSGSVGELDFGSLGGSDAAGSIVTPTMTFGAGAGTINFNQTNSLTITSAISGPGTIQQLGSGTTILSGSNSYTGTTIISNGTLEAASSNAFGASAMTLGGGTNSTESLAMASALTNLTINSLSWGSNGVISMTPGSNTIAITGVMSNAGSGGTFSFPELSNATNTLMTFASQTNFTSNSFSIAGITGYTFVLNNTNLQGYFAANANVTNSSRFTLSDTLEVGNFTQTEGGILQINVASPNSYGNIHASGNVFFGGTLEITPTGNTPLTYGEKLTIVNSAGPIKGTFSSVVIDQEGCRANLQIIGDPEAIVTIAPTSYTLVAQNQNQHNVASALDSFIPATGGDDLTVKNALDSLTTEQYPNAFNQISPALYTTLATVAFNSAVAQYNEMVQRLGNIRVAGVGFSSMGMNESPIMDDSKNPKSTGKDILIPSVDNHWGCFVDGNGIFANVNIGNQLPGYSAEGGGVTIGSDYKWNNEFSTGLYVGYEGMQSKQSGGNYVSDNGSRFGAFGTYQHGGIFANAILGGDSHSYQVNRGIQFPGMSRTANSAPTAGELDSMLAGGYDMKRGNFTFGPITSLQYTYFGLQPFTESGANSLDLSVANANDNSMVYSLGSHCFYTWQFNKNILVVPQINLGWQHEFLQNPYALNSTFSNGSSFAYNSTTPLRDSLYTGVGFTVNLDKKYDASFFYNASACNPSIMSQNFFVSLGTRF